MNEESHDDDGVRPSKPATGGAVFSRIFREKSFIISDEGLYIAFLNEVRSWLKSYQE